MKLKIITLILCLCTFCTGRLQAQDDNKLFPYPTLPEDNNLSLSERCNYLVYNFWDRCNIKQSFSHLKKLDDAFGTWVSFMPYATADTVHLSIDRFIASVEKAVPKQILEIGKIAENWLYTDTAEYMSEELYEPFCEAVVRSKKVSSAEKARFESQLQIIRSSGLGKRVPAFEFYTPTGEKANFNDVIASRVILFFNDPDCIDCMMMKARLSADYNLNQLIDQGLVKLCSIYPGEATEEWCKIASGYPESWVVGAAPDIDMYFSIPETPQLYYLDGRHKVLGKNIALDNLLYAIAQINAQQKAPVQASPSDNQ